MTWILHKYWSCKLKRLRRAWLFSFSYLMRLTVCSPPWSCLQSWTSSRMPTWSRRGWWAQEKGRGGTRSYPSTGRTNGCDCTSPCEERIWQVWDGPVFHPSPVPPVGSALRWHPQSEFFEVGMMPCRCLSCLGHLAALPWNTWRCHGCRHPENTALGVPQLPCHHGGGGSLPKAIFGIPPLHGQCHHN